MMTPSSRPGGPEAIKAARTTWRRSQIVESAARLMEEHGFHDMSVSALAREAGISVGTVYQYVDNKEDVLLLVIEDILKAYAQQVPQAMSGIADPLERLAAGFLSYCGVVDSYQTATLLAYRESRSLSRSGLHSVISHEIETTGLLVAELDAAVAAGTLRTHDTALVGSDLVFLAHMWALKRWQLRDRMTVEAYGRAQLGLVLGGLIDAKQRERYAHLLAVPGAASAPARAAARTRAGGGRR